MQSLTSHELWPNCWVKPFNIRYLKFNDVKSFQHTVVFFVKTLKFWDKYNGLTQDKTKNFVCLTISEHGIPISLKSCPTISFYVSQHVGRKIHNCHIDLWTWSIITIYITYQLLLFLIIANISLQVQINMYVCLLFKWRKYIQYTYLELFPFPFLFCLLTWHIITLFSIYPLFI